MAARVIFLLCLLTGAWAQTPAIRILYPNGGEILNRQSRVEIRWESSGAGRSLVIVLFKNGLQLAVISPLAVNSGRFEWFIPATLPAGDDYRLRLRSLPELALNDFSDKDFSIR